MLVWLMRRIILGLVTFVFVITFFAGCAHTPGQARRGLASSDEAISFENESYKFDGTLTYVPGSSTVAVFVHGSGVLDRDETFPSAVSFDGKENKFFRSISVALASNGVSTYRYDKRGFREKGAKDFEVVLKTMSYENLKGDAWAAIEKIRSLGRFKKAILIGHSEGTAIISEMQMEHPADEFIDRLVLLISS